MTTTAETKRSAFIEAANAYYTKHTSSDMKNYNKADFANNITGHEYATIEDAMIAGEEAATLILEEEREKLEASKAAAALGRKGGKVKSEKKSAASAANFRAAAANPDVRKARSERMKAIHEGKRVISEFGASAVAQWFDCVGDGSYLKSDKDYDYAVAKKIRDGKGQYDVGLFADAIREGLKKD